MSTAAQLDKVIDGAIPTTGGRQKATPIKLEHHTAAVGGVGRVGSGWPKVDASRVWEGGLESREQQGVVPIFQLNLDRFHAESNAGGRQNVGNVVCHADYGFAQMLQQRVSSLLLPVSP